jgi:hypothetical protein
MEKTYGIGEPLIKSRVGNKKPTQKKPKNPPKKPSKNVFFGVFLVFI